MKKLLPFLGLLLGALVVNAQQSTRNSISIAAGLNWFFQYSDLSDARYLPRTGFGAGADYTRSLGNRWQVKIGFRYNEWHSVSQKGNLQWPSEFGPDGTWTPDPSLPRSVEIPLTDKGLQYMAGIRRLGKPGTWRWYADLEAGITDYLEQHGGNTPLRFTVGAGAGMEWRPVTHHFGLFLQPLVRYITRISPDSAVDFHFLAPAVEGGARWHF